MKKQAGFSRSLTIVAVVTLAILMIPFLAMQFTSQVKWGPFDFVIMGMLIFGTGFSYVLLNRLAPNWIYRMALILTVGTTFLMLWANMAVGLIGSGPNAANIMYMVMVFVVIAGAIISRFTAAGMEKAMYVTTAALVLLTSIALLTGMDQYPGSSSTELLTVGSFFSALFLLAGVLFRAAKNPKLAQNI